MQLPQGCCFTVFVEGRACRSRPLPVLKAAAACPPLPQVFRGARKGRGLVVSPKDYSTKYRY